MNWKRWKPSERRTKAMRHFVPVILTRQSSTTVAVCRCWRQLLVITTEHRLVRTKLNLTLCSHCLVIVCVFVLGLVSSCFCVFSLGHCVWLSIPVQSIAYSHLAHKWPSICHQSPITLWNTYNIDVVFVNNNNNTIIYKVHVAKHYAWIVGAYSSCT